MSKIQSPEKWQVKERLVSTLEYIQVPNGTWLGVRRSKRPLFACYTCCKFSMKTPQNSVKISNSVTRSSSVTGSHARVMSSMEDVFEYSHAPECHVTFGRGGLHIVW